MGETGKLFTINSYEIMFLRKFITLSIIAILFFSSLSFTITTPLSKQQQRETETQTSTVDVDPLGLIEELELQDPTGTLENKEEELLTEPEPTEPEPTEPEPTEPEPTEPEPTEPEPTEPEPTEYEIPDIDSGKVRTVGVEMYSDSSLNNPLSSIDWGTLEPGANKNVECYIQNTGKTATILTLETGNWTPPETATYITLTWDYNGQTLKIDEMIRITLILTISGNIQGVTGFFFDIIIIGSSI